MSELITTTDNSDLTTMSISELHDQLKICMSDTAKQIRRMADIVKALEDRGEDMSNLRIGMLSYLRRIASGQVDEQVITRYSSLPTLVHRISSLPINDQRKIIADGAVECLGKNGDVVEIAPENLLANQVTQVFAKDGHIRSIEEQKEYIAARSAAKKPKPQSGLKNVRLIPELDKIRFGRRDFSRTQILELLALLSGPRNYEEEDSREKTAIIKLTDDEHRKLKILAAENDTTMSAIILDSLRATGVI